MSKPTHWMLVIFRLRLTQTRSGLGMRDGTGPEEEEGSAPMGMGSASWRVELGPPTRSLVVADEPERARNCRRSPARLLAGRLREGADLNAVAGGDVSEL